MCVYTMRRTLPQQGESVLEYASALALSFADDPLEIDTSVAHIKKWRAGCHQSRAPTVVLFTVGPAMERSKRLSTVFNEYRDQPLKSTTDAASTGSSRRQFFSGN